MSLQLPFQTLLQLTAQLPAIAEHFQEQRLDFFYHNKEERLHQQLDNYSQVAPLVQALPKPQHPLQHYRLEHLFKHYKQANKSIQNYLLVFQFTLREEDWFITNLKSLQLVGTYQPTLLEQQQLATQAERYAAQLVQEFTIFVANKN